jgi:hypothetical protein
LSYNPAKWCASQASNPLEIVMRSTENIVMSVVVVMPWQLSKIQCARCRTRWCVLSL